MTLKRICLHCTLLTLFPIGHAKAVSIASTTFDGQTISGNIASDLGWNLNGVEDPGSMSAFVGDSGADQNLFNSNAFNQNQFAPLINVGNGNTFWRTSVDLTVSADSEVVLTDVTFDYWAINGGGVQNVGRRSDFVINLYDPSNTVVGTASILDVSNGAAQPPAGSPTAVSLVFSAPVALSEAGTYRLEIDGGELGGADETGNHTGIDNLSINGTNGADDSAPNPDPMTFEVAPTASGLNSITMTATTATDDSGVEYLFTNTTLSTDSGWLNETEWTDTGLTAGTEYVYTVTARDKSLVKNTTAPSDPVAVSTDATDVNPPTPNPMTFAVLPTRLDNTSVTMTATTATDDSGVEYLFKNVTLGTESDWQGETEWIDTGLAPDGVYEYTVTARDTSPARSETSPSAIATAIAPVKLAGVIAATSFDGQMIDGNGASNLNWILDGVEDPGAMFAFREDGETAQNLFNSTDFNQNLFAPQINVGNSNTFWRTSVDLTVSVGSSVTLTGVAFDYWAISGGGVQNVGRRSDFTITLYDPSDEVAGTASILDVYNGNPQTPAGSPTAVSLSFPASVVLNAPGTYRLEIDAGELGGDDETGNHTGIDNLQIVGTNGFSAPFAITGIEYDPVGEFGPTVMLTWRKTSAASYTVKYSLDMIDWSADLDDEITSGRDENPDDADHITVTLPLIGPLENVPDAFFRIEAN